MHDAREKIVCVCVSVDPRKKLKLYTNRRNAPSMAWIVGCGSTDSAVMMER